MSFPQTLEWGLIRSATFKWVASQREILSFMIGVLPRTHLSFEAIIVSLFPTFQTQVPDRVWLALMRPFGPQEMLRNLLGIILVGENDLYHRLERWEAGGDVEYATHTSWEGPHSVHQYFEFQSHQTLLVDAAFFLQWIPLSGLFVQKNLANRLSYLLAIVMGSLKTANWLIIEAKRMKLIIISLRDWLKPLCCHWAIFEEVVSWRGVKCWDLFFFAHRQSLLSKPQKMLWTPFWECFCIVAAYQLLYLD